MMLVETSPTNSRKSATFSLGSDANGNITDYLQFQVSNFTFQVSTVAHYEYSPFGQVTFQSGEMADSFAFRYSTKYLDAETGLYYYGYRYYSPVLGRWPSRDPSEELGGKNLYAFVVNGPVDRVDLLGLWRWPWQGCCSGQTYNRFDQCCCSDGTPVTDGGAGCKLVSKKKVKTGIKRVCQYGRKIGGLDFPWHCWIEWDGGSAGYWPGSTIMSPDPYASTPKPPPNPKPVPEEEKLSLCEYDIKAVKSCIADAANGGGNLGLPPYKCVDDPYNMWSAYDCRNWSRDVISKCKEKGKGKCTMP